MFDEQWPRLEGLFALSKARGLDVRPTLLRVLTDLFVDSAVRSDGEVERYAELATHLVGQVDEETRFVVAGKLGPCAHAPRAVIDRLIASEPEAAGRIIAASPLLTSDDLWTLAADGGPMTCAAIAKRDDLDGELVRFLARKDFPLVAETLVLNNRASLDREAVMALAPTLSDAPDLARRLAHRRDVDAGWLGALFLMLDERVRALVLDAYRLDGLARRTATRETLVSAPTLILDALEYAALSRRPDDVAVGLADALRIEPERASTIVADPSGEALALALIAIGMPTDQAARVMMFACAEVGGSVERLRSLSLLMDRTPRIAAARLVRAMAPARGAAAVGYHETIFAEGPPGRSAPANRKRDRESRDLTRKSGV